jgi:hypothetical protein
MARASLVAARSSTIIYLHEVLGEEMIYDDGEYLYEGGQHAYEPRCIDFPIDHYQWEAGMRTEILEFHGVLQPKEPKELLEWLSMVEKVLELKGILDDKRVQQVATQFHGRAITWWQQLKLSKGLG